MTVENTCCCCQGKTKHRTPEEQKKLLNRLCRIEGQVRGLQEMLQKDAYCPEILIQVSAVGAALNSFSKELLATHIRTCVARFYRADKSRTGGSHCGLGLSMVKWIAEAHGGSVEVVSKEGEGSEFVFHLRKSKS